MNFQNAQFVKSAAEPRGFIRDGRPCIVFAGKSNVGKSSVINRLLGRRNFARVGSAPGKTAQINYFLIDDAAYFTDLPGYGFARVSKAERDRWGELMESFFAESNLITLGVMIVDARHAPTGDDETMAAWFRDSGRPYLVCANKTDKVKKSELPENLRQIRFALGLADEAPLLPFSAETGAGKTELLSEILKYC